MKNPHILVLGVGNVLMSDEGAGVHCIHRLLESFSFSDNIDLLDGGTLGTKLLGPMSEASAMIVIDVALQGCPPGTISRLSVEDIRAHAPDKHSMHELSFSETLFMAEAMSVLPPTVIIAIEPLDMATISTNLTQPVGEKLEELCGRVLEEITIAGGSFTPKTAGTEPWSFHLKPQ